MTLSGLPKAELQETLQSLERLRDATRGEYEQKQMQYDQIVKDLRSLLDSIRSVEGSISVVRKALGLPQAQPPEIEVTAPDGDSRDTTREVMDIVANNQDVGGITFDQIYQALKEGGIFITRMYLHTILNRKKNRQKKLEKRGDKWFLTPKGKEELGLRD